MRFFYVGRLLNAESIPRRPPLKPVGPLPLTRNRFQIFKTVSIAEYIDELRSSFLAALQG
jgi:hypothetical protein